MFWSYGNWLSSWEIPVAAAVVWCIWGSHWEKARNLCDKRREISSELEIYWQPAVCFASCLSARQDVKTSLACGKQEWDKRARQTLPSPGNPGSALLPAWHHGKGMITEDVTSRADCTDLSHGTISSAWGYGFYGVATQIQNLRELSGQIFWPMPPL